MSQRSGIVLVDKNEGYTSSDTVRMLARRLGSRKAGHTGTLDKFASGLLVCLAGSFTRLAPYLVDQDKGYEALIEFGSETETLDPEGVVTRTAAVPGLRELEAILPRFAGEIEQRPPLYSAVHIDGKRAYKRARAGEEVEMPLRRIRIDRLELVGYDPPHARVRIDCSKGTYIRSLARDIALAAESAAHLAALRRTRVGNALVQDGIIPSEAGPDTELKGDRGSIEELLGVRGETVPAGAVADFLNGRAVEQGLFGAEGEDRDVFCFDPDDRFLGVLKERGGILRYGMVNGGARD